MPLERQQFGMRALLDDPSVTDVLIDGPGEVLVERAGGLAPSGLILRRPEIDALIEFASNIPSNSMRMRAVELYNQARRYYAAQAGSQTETLP
mgnify:CR=1 FL=1